MATVADRTHPKPLRARLDPVRSGSERCPVSPNISDKAAFLSLVDEARIRAGMSRKEMAINAQVPESAFSEAMSGTRGNFAIHWLDRQGPLFWLAFHKITAERYGLSEQSAHEAWAERIGELVTLLIKSRQVA